MKINYIKTLIDSVPDLVNKKLYGFSFLSIVFLLSSCLKDRTFPIPVSAPTGTLVINEFMASETLDFGNELGTGSGSDWIELYNGTDTVITFGANQWYLTDDTIGSPTKFKIPATIQGNNVTIQPKGYLVIYADNSDTTLTQIHANFKLGHASGDIGLYYEKLIGAAVFADAYTYSVQSSNISFGRLPNGGSNWQQCTTPTPGAANQ